MTNTIDIDAPIPLAKSVDLIFPEGGGTLNTVRTLIRKGDLQVERIGRRFFTTRRYIYEMREKCRVKPKAHIYGSEKSGATSPASSYQAGIGSSSTIVSISPQSALKQKLNKLKKN